MIGYSARRTPQQNPDDISCTAMRAEVYRLARERCTPVRTVARALANLIERGTITTEELSPHGDDERAVRDLRAFAGVL